MCLCVSPSAAWFHSPQITFLPFATRINEPLYWYIWLRCFARKEALFKNSFVLKHGSLLVGMCSCVREVDAVCLDLAIFRLISCYFYSGRVGYITFPAVMSSWAAAQLAVRFPSSPFSVNSSSCVLCVTLCGYMRRISDVGSISCCHPMVRRVTTAASSGTVCVVNASLRFRERLLSVYVCLLVCDPLSVDSSHEFNLCPAVSPSWSIHELVFSAQLRSPLPLTLLFACNYCCVNKITWYRLEIGNSSPDAIFWIRSLLLLLFSGWRQRLAVLFVWKRGWISGTRLEYLCYSVFVDPDRGTHCPTATSPPDYAVSFLHIVTVSKLQQLLPDLSFLWCLSQSL